VAAYTITMIHENRAIALRLPDICLKKSFIVYFRQICPQPYHRRPVPLQKQPLDPGFPQPPHEHYEAGGQLA
jgi:hypothetical protein